MSVMTVMNPYQVFLDDSGVALAAGTITFNENGTSSAATIYNNPALTVSQSNPYTLDAYGRIIGDVYFSGVLRMVVKDSTGATVRTLDDNVCAIGNDTLAFASWDTNTTYGADDIVKGSDNNFYISLAASNQGNDPTSDATKWSQIRFSGVWNTNETYDANMLVQDSNGILYYSVQGSNTANTPSTTPAYWTATGAQPVSNLIPVGDFSLNLWQEGTSFAAIADQTYFADLFEYLKVGTMVHTVTKATDAPTVAEAGYYSANCIKLDTTTADATLGAGDYCAVRYFLEGYNFSQIAQSKFLLAFWHKHTKIGTYCVGFRNSGQDRSYVAEYSQAVTDTWELALIPVTASPSAGTWDYTTGIGLEIVWCFGSGATFQTTADSWQTGSYFATSNQVNATDNVANNNEINLVQLIPGTAKTPYPNFTPTQVGQYAKRYFNRMTSAGGSEWIANTFAYLAQFSYGMFYHPVEMRAAPTVTDSVAANFDINLGGTQIACISVGGTGYTDRTRLVGETASGVAQDSAAALSFDSNSGTTLDFDSRL